MYKRCKKNILMFILVKVGLFNLKWSLYILTTFIYSFIQEQKHTIFCVCTGMQNWFSFIYCFIHIWVFSSLLFFSYSSDLMNCDFESSSWQTDSGCGLVQSYSDNFQWSWRSGSTPSSSTGPSSASKGSYYLYIETSSTSLNARAVLMSSYLNTSNTIYFLIRNQFWNWWLIKIFDACSFMLSLNLFVWCFI